MLNPMKISDLHKYIMDYDRFKPFYARPYSRKVWATALESKNVWRLMTYLTTELPLNAFLL